VGARYDDVVPGSQNTRDQVEAVFLSDSAGEGQTRLSRGLLGLATQPTGRHLLATATELLRLSQARGHVCAREVLVHEVHHDLSPVLFSVLVGHGCLRWSDAG
jgi:hypothetical protein